MPKPTDTEASDGPNLEPAHSERPDTAANTPPRTYAGIGNGEVSGPTSDAPAALPAVPMADGRRKVSVIEAKETPWTPRPSPT